MPGMAANAVRSRSNASRSRKQGSAIGAFGKFIPIRLAMEVHALAQTEHVFVNGCFDKDLREEKLGY